jgi:hypothetical protein
MSQEGQVVNVEKVCAYLHYGIFSDELLIIDFAMSISGLPGPFASGVTPTIT